VSESLETVACNLCGSQRWRQVYRMPDTKYAKGEWFDVVACLDCGLGFVNPRPVASAMGRFYPGAFFADFEQKTAHHLRRYAREAAFLDDVTASVEGKRRLLDIGCANGDFPRYMRARGWDVEGVEIADAARAIEDFPVYRQPFPALASTAGPYDAVTAWAVLEHVHDPMAYFRKAAAVLRPGGRFVFLVTNFESPTSRHLFREDVPRHLYFFTRSCVRAYLEKNGLILDRWVCDGSIFEMIPLHWLRHLLRTALGRPQMRYEDIPETRLEWLARTGRSGSFAASLTYAATHPLTTLDRALLPPYQAWQRWRGTYGIITYVAHKPDASRA
jgi:SAM-dependent methyltransferase